MADFDPQTWYLVRCIDCAKDLRVRGEPPDKPICLHCSLLRHAPEATRATLRATLTWTGETDEQAELEIAGSDPP